jgi:choline kinase/histidinol-phosphate/aromatic aminotransferase/cobyric acid decarboxylase-like protein
MQAIILAAGLGKRLGNLTLNNTKCMVKVNGIPLIERMLRQLDKLDLEKIVLVIGYEGEKLRFFTDSLRIATKLEYVTNEIYDKTNNIYSLYLAKDYMLAGDTLLLEADLVFEDSLLKKLMDDPWPDLALVSKFEEWMDGTCVKIDRDNNILRFIPKKEFVYEESGEYYKTVNIYKFSHGFLINHYVPFLEAYMKACGLNDYYEQVLRITSYLDKPLLKALPLLNDRWYEIDNLEDLNIAETIIDSGPGRFEKTSKRGGGMWRFPSVTDFSGPGQPGFPGKRMLSEIRVNSDRLISSAPSGREVTTLLAAKYFNVETSYVCVAGTTDELIRSALDHTAGSIGLLQHSLPGNLAERYGSRIAIFSTPEGAPLSSEHLLAFCKDRQVSVLLIRNPDPHTGIFIGPDDFQKVLEFCGENSIRLITDTSLSDLAEGSGGHCHLFSNAVLERFPNLAVVYDYSVANGIAGLQAAVLGSSDHMLTRGVLSDLPVKAFNSLAEFYLQIAGKYESDYNRACKDFIAERKRFSAELSALKIFSVLPSQTDTLLCEVHPPDKAALLATELLSRNDILVGIPADTGANGAGSMIRIAVRSREENDRLAKILAGYGNV